jgi:hypothetical protein
MGTSENQQGLKRIQRELRSQAQVEGDSEKLEHDAELVLHGKGNITFDSALRSWDPQDIPPGLPWSPHL